MDAKENERNDEIQINNSKLIQIDALYTVCKSICRIITPEGIGTGFFIKLEKKEKPFYCLMTCEHVIKKELIEQKTTIELFYNNQEIKRKIDLDSNKRFIRCYKYLNIDAILMDMNNLNR